MSIGSYFVTNESEQAGMQAIAERYKNASAAKANLGGQMNELAEKLAKVSEALKFPGTYAIRADASEIVIARDRHPVARLEPADINWQRLIDLFNGYDKANRDKKESAARLKDMGLPVEER